MENQFCTFTVATQLFGLQVEKVDEVIAGQALTEVPLAPVVFAGLLNRRGQLVTAIDLRTRLGLEPREGSKLPVNVIVRTANQRAISLVADSIGDVVELDDRTKEPLPDSLHGAMKDLTESVYKLPHCLMLVLDAEKAVNVSGAANTE